MDFISISKETRNKRRWVLIACFFLLLVSSSVYWQVRHFDFINFDDDVYVADNRQVRSGLTKENLAWSFSFQDKEKTYWHPLTWISHMLDVELYGMDAGRHHHTNALFHTFNTLLLFFLLYRITGALWRSAFVAALFALHPINVESVAWIAQRKNVLSTFFWMLTLLAYTVYQKRPGIVRYLTVLFVFTLGLLAKPMLVTLPFVLMLLDYWPLKRIGFQPSIRECLPLAFRLVLEKFPLFILSGLSVYFSMASRKGLDLGITLQSIPAMLRIENALVSYLKYIGNLVWPTHLTVFYPYPDKIPMWQALGALVVLMVISVGVVRTLRKYPYLCVGWLWYLGTLTPVIGFVQVGLWPQMADRWAYVPFIGLFVIISWGGAELLSRWRHKRFWAAIAVSALLTALMVASHIQVGYWANSVTLFSHALKITKDKALAKALAHNNLATELIERGQYDEAIYHFSQVLKIKNDNAPVHNNLAIALNERGRYDEALYHANTAIKLSPYDSSAYNNLGYVFLKINKYDDAIRNFKMAIKLNPTYTKAYFNLASALTMIGNFDAATSNYRIALDLSPDSKVILNDLANAMVARGRVAEALPYYSKALDLDPSDADIHNNMGVALIHLGRFNEAVSQFRLALKLKPDFADAGENLKKALSRQP
jgi:tetratricopeptide (TPR) repeat protein